MRKGLLSALIILFFSVGNAFSQSMLISGGNDHAVALCSKGKIFAWGYNKGNRLGLLPPNDTKTVVNKPAMVDIPNTLTFSQVTAGSGSHNVALSCKKIAYAWGENNTYQAGQSTGDIVSKPMPVLCGEAGSNGHGYEEDGVTAGPYLGDVKKIAATTSASIALLEDGTAVIWGGNGDFQGGDDFPLFKEKTYEPIYIRDENNKILKNIIDIYGGDNNLSLIVGSSPTDMTGTVYSMGNWNGRGADGLNINDECFVAMPVIIADPNNGALAAAGNKTLTAVKTSGIADAGGFAFDENEGYLYSWGNNGWGGMVGAITQTSYRYASKVISGQYSTISKEPYMTNVHQVIGGNGYGALVTEDGYLLYMGNNNLTGRDGGIIPNSEESAKYPNGTITDPGPVFAKYCKGEKDPAQEVIVNDAAAIGRGDLFGFMVNRDGDFYVWGNTKCPGTSMPAEVGTLGLGFDGKADDPQGKGYRTCLSKITLDCDPQDECPKVYMIGPRYKCPGEKDSLYCGFTPTTRSVANYYFKWSLNGVVKGSVTQAMAEDLAQKVKNGTATEAEKKAVLEDPWNNWIVEIEDPGIYTVEIIYVGNNVPCSNCENAIGKIEVIDMEMPVDIDTLEVCVSDFSAPSSTEKLEFKATVNDKFYKATDNVTFTAFATPTSTDTLKDINGKNIVINTTGNGGEIKFKVFGDKIDRTLGVDPREDIDTLYHVWLEDITKFETVLSEETPTISGTYQSYTNIFNLKSSAELVSFDLWGKGYGTPVSVDVTPVIYNAGKIKDGQYIFQGEYKICDTQTITFGGNDITKQTVKIGLKLPGNSARGSVYVLGLKFSASNFNLYLFGFPDYEPSPAQQPPVMFDDPIEDPNNFGITIVGATANGFTTAGATRLSPFTNITFGKLTDYNCGRIPLTARLYCPPCNNPEELEIISSNHTIKTDVDPKYKKVVELCKESDPLDLDIKTLVGQTDPAAKFDILWYGEDPQKNASAVALKSDETGAATNLAFSTDWATVAGATDITEDAEKVYYVYVHDHDKVGCPNYDSIKVIAHPVPADTLAWNTFCLTSPIDEPDFTKTALGNPITWTTDPTGTFATLTDTKSFTYTVKDDNTGCLSDPHDYIVTVNKTPKPQVETSISKTKEVGIKYQLSSAVIPNTIETDCEIRWYDSETGSTEISEISLDVATTITVWAEQYNTTTDCASTRVEVTIDINDTPKPTTYNESLCIGDVIPDLSQYVEPLPNHTLYWYSDFDAEKGTGDINAFSYTATDNEPSKTFYVSQKDNVTGAESEKAKITITVHKVCTLDLAQDKTEYCINETPIGPLKYTLNTDADVEPERVEVLWSELSTMNSSNSFETLTPKTDVKGDKTYYAQPKYKNLDRRVASNASEYCLGEINSVTITTNKTEKPTSNTEFTIQYLAKDVRPDNTFAPLLTQKPDAVIKESGHELIWHDENKNVIPSEPAPNYDPSNFGNETLTFWVSQKNTTTGCESELQKVTVNISTYPAPIVKEIHLCQGSDLLKQPYILTAEINKEGGVPESEYTLLWFKEDPKTNPGQSGLTSIDLSTDQDIVAYNTSGTQLEYQSTFYVVQKHISGEMSPASELNVILFKQPKLTALVVDPICLGEKVDLSKYYQVSDQIPNVTYENQYLNTGGDLTNDPVVDKQGYYKSRSYFVLDNGEVCTSSYEDIYVTVNELEVSISGDNTTCPGIGVDLDAVLTTNMDENIDVPTYTWDVSPTGLTGSLKSFNTTGLGLENDKKITVNLKVEMGACTKRATALTVNVKFPGLSGFIKFDEEDNTNSGSGYALDNSITKFDGCNKEVEVMLSNVTHTEDKIIFEKIGSTDPSRDNGEATFSGNDALFKVKAGIYEVTYTNTCETKFQFEIVDKSLDVKETTSNWAVCEGKPLTIKIVNAADNSPFEFDPRKYTVQWWKDDQLLPSFTTEVLYIPSTTPNDNGIYKYKVISSGCVYSKKVNWGSKFTSKPLVKIDSARLENNGIYEVVRGKSKDITIPFLQPNMSNYDNKIIWKEDGTEVNRGATYNLTNVTSDHEYQIEIAGGNKLTDTELCGTNLDLTLKVDALLSIDAVLVNNEGEPTRDMCVNEEGVGFEIDTTGTGTVLHPDKLKLTVIETIGSQKKEIKPVPKEDDGKLLFAGITPNASATYEIIYKYDLPNPTDKQDKSTNSAITVHPAYQVDWDRNVRICDEETGFINITKAEPASDIILNWKANDCLVSGSKTGATVSGNFTGTGLLETKQLILVASNGGICADKEYTVEFMVDKKIEPIIEGPDFICENHTAKLDAQKSQATEYIWSSVEELGENVTMTGATINVVPKTMYAIYNVEMKRGACTEHGEISVDVRYAPKFDRIDSLSFRSIEIVVQPSTGTAPFQYIVDDNRNDDLSESIKENLEYGIHNIKVTDEAGCVIDTTITINAPGLDFPVHISPNGDGKDDVFSIPTLRDAYPDANIRIFDRWGKKLADYKAGDSEMDWDGTYKGSAMPSTDYWYEIEIKEIKKTYTGHFTLIRQ